MQLKAEALCFLTVKLFQEVVPLGVYVSGFLFIVVWYKNKGFRVKWGRGQWDPATTVENCKLLFG